MVTVAAPKIRAPSARASERLSVIAADDEERRGVLRWESLDTFPGAHEILERLLVAVGVFLLEFLNRPADPQSANAVRWDIFHLWLL